MERRELLTVLAGSGFAGFAGCVGNGDDAQNGDETTDVAFREWLTNPDVTETTRFEYSETQIEQAIEGRLTVLNLDPQQVEGYLIQLPALILFGDFDVSRLEATLEETDEYRLAETYESYRMAYPLDTEESDDGLVESQFALGTDAVLLGRDLDLWIDTQNGDSERLEESYPIFEDLFRRLPDQTNVTGQLGRPPTWEEGPDGLEAWGTSVPTLDPGEITQTWIYAFTESPTTNQIERVEQNLSDTIVESIDQTETDNRFLTVTGTVLIPDTDESN